MLDTMRPTAMQGICQSRYPRAIRRPAKPRKVVKPGANGAGAKRDAGDLSITATTPTPTFGAINKKRADNGISVQALVRAADLDWRTWRLARKAKGNKTKPDTLVRINAALDRMIAGGPVKQPKNLIAAMIEALELIIKSELAGDAGLIGALAHARHRKDGAPLDVEPERIRRIAIYLAAVELEVQNADIARALGCRRQNIHQARDQVEELRNSKAVDAFLDRCANKVRPA